MDVCEIGRRERHPARRQGSSKGLFRPFYYKTPSCAFCHKDLSSVNQIRSLVRMILALSDGGHVVVIIVQILGEGWVQRRKNLGHCDSEAFKQTKVQNRISLVLELRSAPPHTGTPGPFGPGTPEESEKSPKRVPRGRAPKVPKECSPESQKSPKRV